MDTVAKRIKLLRKLKKLNQNDFANIIGISQTHISKIESEKDYPSDKLLRLISEEFGISYEWLKNGKGEMEDTTDTSSLSTKDTLLELKKFLTFCDNVENVLSSNMLMNIPKIVKSTESREDNYKNQILLEVSSLIENIVKLNEYLGNESTKIGSNDSAYKKVDEIYCVKDIYKSKISNSIDALVNLYLGSGK